MQLNNFIDTGIDSRTLDASLEQRGDILSKSMNKAGLVQKEVQVKGKNGTFTRKQWVKAGEGNKDTSASQQSQGRFTPSDFQFRSGGQDIANFVNAIDTELGVTKHFNGNVGFGTLTLKNGSTVAFGYDSQSPYVTWNGTRYRDVQSLKAVMKGQKTPNGVNPSKELQDINKQLRSKELSSDQRKSLGERLDKVLASAKDGDTITTDDHQWVKQGDIWHDTSIKFNKLSTPNLSDRLSGKTVALPKSIEFTPNGSKAPTAPKDAGADDAEPERTDDPKQLKALTSSKDFDGNGITIGDDYYWVSKEDDNLWFKDTVANAQTTGELDESDKSIQRTTAQVYEAYTKASKQGKSKVDLSIPKGGDAKSALQRLLKQGVSKNDIMAEAKAQGVEWKHNDHEGINWMRASMAIQKHMQGNTLTGGK